MKILPFDNGEIIRLSAIGEFSYKNDYFDTDVEGVYLKLNDKIYSFYIDADDGYRSYGIIKEEFFYDEDNNIIKDSYIEFPEQYLTFREIEVDEAIDDYYHNKYWMILLYNNEKEVLRLGTNLSDSYYPCAIYQWNPQNLPINKDR